MVREAGHLILTRTFLVQAALLAGGMESTA
jgi:hypothetical protein